MEVSEDEFARAVRKMGHNKAPGPDGIPGKIWVRALGFLGARLMRLFHQCLKQRRFPPAWKRVKLILQKEGREAGSPSAYRPICLLDEVGKLLKRIITNRLVQHLSREGNLHEEQYGFREGRPTIDTILRIRSLAAVEEGRMALAVFVDIANAFDTLPWKCVGHTLAKHGVLRYFVETVGT